MKKAFLLIGIFLFLTAAAHGPDLAELLKQANTEIFQLKVKVSDLEAVNSIISYYRMYCGAKLPNHYVNDPSHLLKVWKIAQKEKHIVAFVKTSIPLDVFMLSWIVDEDNFDPTAVCHNKTGKYAGTHDKWITQINNKTEPRLLKVWGSYVPGESPDKVRKEDSIRYGILLMYIHIGEDYKAGREWALLSNARSRGWDFYEYFMKYRGQS